MEKNIRINEEFRADEHFDLVWKAERIVQMTEAQVYLRIKPSPESLSYRIDMVSNSIKSWYTLPVKDRLLHDLERSIKDELDDLQAFIDGDSHAYHPLFHYSTKLKEIKEIAKVDLIKAIEIIEDHADLDAAFPIHIKHNEHYLDVVFE